MSEIDFTVDFIVEDKNLINAIEFVFSDIEEGISEVDLKEKSSRFKSLGGTSTQFLDTNEYEYSVENFEIKKNGKVSIGFFMGTLSEAANEHFFELILKELYQVGCKELRGSVYNTQVGEKYGLEVVDGIPKWVEHEEYDFEEEYIVITGTLEDYTRDEIAEELEDLGAIVQSSVNGKTTMLVIGAKPGKSKITKAAELGIKVLEEEDFIELLGSCQY